MWFKKNKWPVRITVVLLIAVLAGPELGVGIELHALANLLGGELFLLMFVVGFRLLWITYVLDPSRNFLERIDPYFFIPTKFQIQQCPGMIAHAIPCFIATYVGWILMAPPSIDT